MNKPSVLPKEIESDSTYHEDEGLDKHEHIEMAWHLREMQTQLVDMRSKLQMAFPQDNRYEKWVNSMMSGVGRIRAALMKDLQSSHEIKTVDAKEIYK